MSTASTTYDATVDAGASASAATANAPTKRRSRDVYLYALLVLLTLGAWQFSRLGLFRSGDDIGYWLGVAGGTMMLILFLYPLRKYARFMHRWGKVKWWFVAHMILGIGGPLLILLHSTFTLRSLNATIAFLSMVIVAGSGVVGRFLYLRIHHGLEGERSNLKELQRKAGLAEGDMRSRFRFAPEVAQRLLAFEAQTLEGSSGWLAIFSRVLILPLRQRMVYRACKRELGQRLRLIARERAWSRGHLLRRRTQAASLTRYYLTSIVRVAQFTAYERLFALWHVLHIPFVYLLLLTVGFHIFAVHAY